MVNKEEIKAALQKARQFVIEGGNQIMTGSLDEEHGVSASPGATALATLALLALGDRFQVSQLKGSLWLWQHRQPKGWGKYPGDSPDEEVSRLVQTVLQGSRGGWPGRIILLSQARHFAELILSLGKRAVPGLEGPQADEIELPNILQERILNKLPPYGRPVVIAASLLAAVDGQEGISQGLKLLRDTQMPDGSWSEDIVATSMAVLALLRFKNQTVRTMEAGYWLVRKQYSSGAWPAFDQLHTWSMGWAIDILANRYNDENEWLLQAKRWLKKGRNSDGSYGSTPPFTHPDLDDTAVALMGGRFSSESEETIQLLRRLQNEDGSWGTFPDFTGVPPEIECKFPVYIPSPDVTIHVLEGLWRHQAPLQDEAIQGGLNWLLTQQRPDGEIVSIWYEGPIYSTAQMLETLTKRKYSWQGWETAGKIFAAQKKIQDFLLDTRNDDGSWGASAAETALALTALWQTNDDPQDRHARSLLKLLEWQKPNGSFAPAYRGIYAKGWNYEEPLATALTVIKALEKVL